MKNILEYLEHTQRTYPDKIAVDDGNLQISWKELTDMAKRMGTAFERQAPKGSPVVILMEKSAVVLAAMLGTVYAGCFYVMIDPGQPSERTKKIFETLKPGLVVGDENTKERMAEIGEKVPVCLLEEALKIAADEEKLSKIRAESKETDLLYGLFTSGSTGNPKGVVVSHQAVIRFIGHFTDIFGIHAEDRLGNQAPFDFDVSVKDIYSCILTGATLVLIPKAYFSIPAKLVDLLCEQKVTVLVWAVSALCLISSLKGLEYRIPERVRMIMFSGEVMPGKQLRLWQEALPDTEFINLYGPTEITCNCTYYKLRGKWDMREKLPIGQAFPGREVFLSDETGKRITEPGHTGEICVAGESLSDGYYNNEAETRKRFCMEPDQDGKERRCYHTGDLGYFGEDGQLFFAGRKDFQIKHMGHRIELEEIERWLEQVRGVERSCCVLDQERKRLAAFYTGTIKPCEVRTGLKQKVPSYMVPGKIVQVAAMPLNKNGKTDRSYFQKKLEV